VRYTDYKQFHATSTIVGGSAVEQKTPPQK